MADFRELNADEIAEVRDKFCDKLDQLIGVTEFIMKLHGSNELTTDVLGDLDALRNGRKSLLEIIRENDKTFFKTAEKQSHDRSGPVVHLVDKIDSEQWLPFSHNNEPHLKILRSWEPMRSSSYSNFIQGFVNYKSCEISMTDALGEMKILSNVLECYFAIQNSQIIMSSPESDLSFTELRDKVSNQWILEHPVIDKIQHLNSGYERNLIKPSHMNIKNPGSDYLFNMERLVAMR